MWRSCYQEEHFRDHLLQRLTSEATRLHCVVDHHRCEDHRVIVTEVPHQDVEALEGLVGEVDQTMIVMFLGGHTQGPDHHRVAGGRDHILIPDHRRARHHQEGEEEAHQQGVLHGGAEAQVTARTVATAEVGAGLGHGVETGVEAVEARGAGRGTSVGSLSHFMGSRGVGQGQ